MVLKWLVLKCIKKEELRFTLSEQISTIVMQKLLTKVGLLGIKVWICRGEVYGKKRFQLKLYAKQRKRSWKLIAETMAEENFKRKKNNR